MSAIEPTDCGHMAVQRVTPAALLVVDCDGDEHWIPKSQICDESDLGSGAEVNDEGDLLLPEWLAIEKGLA